MKIFLDDERTPPDASWTVVRNVAEFRKLIEEAPDRSITAISLDWCLGVGEPNGDVALAYLITQAAERNELLFNCSDLYLHSSDRARAKEMARAYTRALCEEVMLDHDVRIARYLPRAQPTATAIAA